MSTVITIIYEMLKLAIQKELKSSSLLVLVTIAEDDQFNAMLSIQIGSDLTLNEMFYIVLYFI